MDWLGKAAGSNDPENKNYIVLTALQLGGCTTLGDFLSLGTHDLRYYRIDHESLERYLSPLPLNPVICRGNRVKGYPYPESMKQRILEMQRSIAAGIQKEIYSDDKSDILLLKNIKLEEIDDLSYKVEDYDAVQGRLTNLEQQIANQNQAIAHQSQAIANQNQVIANQNQEIAHLRQMFDDELFAGSQNNST